MSQYRIFTDREGYVSMAAKKVGDTIAVLAEAQDFGTAFNAILEDAGIRVPVLERDMQPSYQPKPEDWDGT